MKLSLDKQKNRRAGNLLSNLTSNVDLSGDVMAESRPVICVGDADVVAEASPVTRCASATSMPHSVEHAASSCEIRLWSLLEPVDTPFEASLQKVDRPYTQTTPAEGRWYRESILTPEKTLRSAYLHVELPFAPVVVHVPNLSEHFALFPSHVVDAHDRPRAPDETVGIPPVQLILVVEEDASVLARRERGDVAGGAARGKRLDEEYEDNMMTPNCNWWSASQDASQSEHTKTKSA